MVVGLVAVEVLFPLEDDEAVWVLRPEKTRWTEQLTRRPAGGTLREYDDLTYSRHWFDRFATWTGRPGVFEMKTHYRPELLGKTARRR